MSEKMGFTGNWGHSEGNTLNKWDEEMKDLKCQNELYRNELKKLAEKADDEKNNSEYRLGLLKKQITKCAKLEDDLFKQKIVTDEKEEMIKFYKILNSIYFEEKIMLIENIKELDDELTEVYTLKSEFQDRLNDVLAWNKEKDNEIKKLHSLYQEHILKTKNALTD